MKNSNKIFIGVLIVSIIIIVLGYMQKSIDNVILIKTDYSYSNIKNIDLNIDSAKVEIKRSNNDKVDVITEGQDKDEFNKVSMENGKLTINQVKTSKKYMSNVWSKVIIKVPKGMELDKINVNIRLGDLTITSVNSKSLISKINGGTTTVESGKFNTLDFVSNGGNVNLNDTNSTSVKANIESGNFMATNNNSEKVKVSIKAGVIYVHELYAKNVNFSNGLGNTTFVNKNKDYKINNLNVDSNHGMKVIEK